MTRQLIVNADDYGLTSGVSAGIRQAHLDGIVTETTTMMNAPDALSALDIALHACPTLGLGVHLVLTYGAPVLPAAEVPTLVDADGRFHRLDRFAHVVQHFSRDELLREWVAQIERFLATGAQLTHLDCHHHAAYRFALTLDALFELADACSVPIRHPNAYRDMHRVEHPDDAAELVRAAQVVDSVAVDYLTRYPSRCETSFYDTGVSVDHLLAIIDGLSDGETVELMTHPGFVDDALRATSSYTAPREREIAVLTDARVRAALEAHAVDLVGFDAIS